MVDSKLLGLVIFIVVSVLLFHYSGFLGDPVECSSTLAAAQTESLPSYMLSHFNLTCPSDIFNSRFLILIATISGSLFAAGIVASQFKASITINKVLMATVGIFLLPIILAILKDLILISQLLSRIHPAFAALFVSTLIIASGFIIFDWVRLRD